jgi:hypothetical protein
MNVFEADDEVRCPSIATIEGDDRRWEGGKGMKKGKVITYVQS